MKRKSQQSLNTIPRNLVQDLPNEQASQVTGGEVVAYIILYNNNTSSVGDRTSPRFATGGWGG